MPCRVLPEHPRAAFHHPPARVNAIRALGRRNPKAPVRRFFFSSLLRAPPPPVRSRSRAELGGRAMVGAAAADPIAGSSAYSSSINSYPTSNTNSYYMSPSRMSNSSQMGGATSHPADYNHAPTSAGPIGSPGFPAPPSLLPSINQVHEPSQRQSQEFPPPESRRSSLGSQVNQGLNSLHINGNGSPYTGSVNHSQTSLAQNLSRERGITHHSNGTRPSRSSGQQLPMSPLSPHAAAETRIAFTPRIAPPIGRNPRSDIYNADDPIPGQAYAFPDPPDVQPGDLPPMPGQRAHSNTDDGRPGMFSRRDSGHTSITSSIVTSDSRLPAGQRRLDESEFNGSLRGRVANARGRWHAGYPSPHAAAKPTERSGRRVPDGG